MPVASKPTILGKVRVLRILNYEMIGELFAGDIDKQADDIKY
jgi:hypothetical protein